MVKTASVICAVAKGLSKQTKFVDRVRVYVRGGAGGQGFPKFGGLGGKGGDVIFVAREGRNLYDFVNKYPEKRFIAKSGSDSKRLMLLGCSGDNLEVEVPTGVVFSLDSGLQFGDLNKENDRIVVAGGGEGGGPHNDFKAGKGDAKSIRIDLKLLADIGLVGFPNAGKSTFLKAVSRTNPKIADYPFTTLRPQLGTMTYADHRQITVADLPGLIEGAHLNLGMGHFFLKHVERTKLLLVIVDINGFVLNERSSFRTAYETVVLLNKELELYKPSLLEKPQVLLVNKMDSAGADELYRRTSDMVKHMPDHLHTIDEELRPKRLFNFSDIMPMSASLGVNIENVKATLRRVIDDCQMTSEERLKNVVKLTERIDMENIETVPMRFV